jgi:hypothetical protein
MKCPQCNQPLTSGLYLCPKCSQRADDELLVIAAMDGQTEFAGLPIPLKFEWKGGCAVATYREEDWLSNRALFNALSRDGCATSARTPRDAVYTVKFHRLDRIRSALKSANEFPF